jgi:hypothetical protein
MRTTSRSSKTKLTALALASSMTLGTWAPAVYADEVAGSPKGLVGGALLGGEVVTITESLIGAHSGWWYAIGFVVGAGGGGAGGYFVDKGSTDGRPSMYMLAGGLALVIPALVLTLNATRYQGSDTATEDKPPVNAPVANPGTPGGSVVSPESTPPPLAPTTPPTLEKQSTPPPGATPTPPSSLLDIQIDVGGGSGEGTVRLGLPVPDVRPMYSMREQQQYGLPQHTEVRMPLLAVRF